MKTLSCDTCDKDFSADTLEEWFDEIRVIICPIMRM